MRQTSLSEIAARDGRPVRLTLVASLSEVPSWAMPDGTLTSNEVDASWACMQDLRRHRHEVDAAIGALLRLPPTSPDSPSAKPARFEVLLDLVMTGVLPAWLVSQLDSMAYISDEAWAAVARLRQRVRPRAVSVIRWRLTLRTNRGERVALPVGYDAVLDGEEPPHDVIEAILLSLGQQGWKVIMTRHSNQEADDPLPQVMRFILERAG